MPVSVMHDGHFRNPYRARSGHMPPHLAGRGKETLEFERLLAHEVVRENLVLTGLRGVGKTVLLDRFKDSALANGWLWVGTDLSGSAHAGEESMATRLLADLAMATSAVTIAPDDSGAPDPLSPVGTRIPLSYAVLREVYDGEPGLVSDKLRTVLIYAWGHLRRAGKSRVIFAYDAAHNFSDNKADGEYPLSVFLDVFLSIQTRGIPFLVVLAGLPTLRPKLSEARPFAERMFHPIALTRLDEAESREAINKPFEVGSCPVSFGEDAVETISKESGGYPYFIQFICREFFDVFIQQGTEDESTIPVPMEAIQVKLDADFFVGRCARATGRQRQLLWVIASLDRNDEEFTIQDIIERCNACLAKPFSPSHTNQMLASLGGQGLVYKNRLGKYAFAVPMLDKFILRTYDPNPPTDPAPRAAVRPQTVAPQS